MVTMKIEAHDAVPLLISFQGCAADADLHRLAVEQVHALARIYGNPTYCHLIIKAPQPERSGPWQACLYLTMQRGVDIHVEVPDHPEQHSLEPAGAIVAVFQLAQARIAEGSRRKRGRRVA
jgi:hypothetical protein